MAGLGLRPNCPHADEHPLTPNGLIFGPGSQDDLSSCFRRFSFLGVGCTASSPQDIWEGCFCWLSLGNEVYPEVDGGVPMSLSYLGQGISTCTSDGQPLCEADAPRDEAGAGAGGGNWHPDREGRGLQNVLTWANSLHTTSTWVPKHCLWSLICRGHGHSDLVVRPPDCCCC